MNLLIVIQAVSLLAIFVFSTCAVSKRQYSLKDIALWLHALSTSYALCKALLMVKQSAIFYEYAAIMSFMAWFDSICALVIVVAFFKKGGFATIKMEKEQQNAQNKVCR